MTQHVKWLHALREDLTTNYTYPDTPNVNNENKDPSMTSPRPTRKAHANGADSPPLPMADPRIEHKKSATTRGTGKPMADPRSDANVLVSPTRGGSARKGASPAKGASGVRTAAASPAKAKATATAGRRSQGVAV